MSTLGIDKKVTQQMIDHAIRTYPDECCGFLFGEGTEERLVTSILPVINNQQGDKRKRYEISSKDYMAAELHADKLGLQLLGVYHSHPDHPAIPSETDRTAALPFFSYIILSVDGKRVNELRSWRLNDDREFVHEETDELFSTDKNKHNGNGYHSNSLKEIHG